MHQSAAIILIDEQGRVLLQHRTADAPTDPGCWGFFGGGVEPGETPEEAVRRETHEELQIALPELAFLGTHPATPGIEIALFSAPLRHSLEELRALQQEGDDVGLFTLAELKRLKMVECDRRILLAVFAAQGIKGR